MDPSEPVPGGRTGSTATVLGLSFAAYLALSVVLWWQVWSSHPTSTTTCGCGDATLFLWFLEWPAYALRHGHDLFTSTALFHPAGVDVLANTSVLAIGVPLAPVTWIWGPVATLNVAFTLTPALGALTMCWLLCRWVAWTPAAFVGGLVFGFSPFVVTNLASAHLMTAALALLPLMVALLDELLVRQRHGAVAIGAALGLLLVVQFFVGTEILVLVVVVGVVGVTLVAAYAAVGHRGELVARAPHAARGLGAATVVATVLLAYPAWVALAGPAHLSGLVWPDIPPGFGGVTLYSLWHVVHSGDLAAVRLISGYQGPSLPTGAYLGTGLLVVLGCGLVAFHRDRRLWCFGALGAVAGVLALGTQPYWTPWRLLARVPVLQNAGPARVMAVVLLCAAVLLGVVLDRTRSAVLRALGARSRGNVPGDGAPGQPAAPAPRWAAGLAGLAGLAVATVAVVPMASAVAPDVPLTARRVVLPRWFAGVAPTLPPGQVLLVDPAPYTLESSAEAWQAVDGLRFAMVGGSGPESVPGRAGPEQAGQEVAGAASVSFVGPPQPTGRNVGALRRALAGWGVTMVVVTDPAGLPRYERSTNPAAALGLFTLATGRAPVRQAGAWVWRDVTSPAARRAIGAGAFGT
ncbi:MAG: hypothetical protein ACRDZR_08985, partial [Acidimicrobiales bacterium]